MKVLSFTFFFIVNITLQCRIWSDSDKDSDEKAKYQDIRTFIIISY